MKKHLEEKQVKKEWKSNVFRFYIRAGVLFWIYLFASVQIADEAMVPIKETREKLYKLLHAEFVYLQGLKK